MGLLSTIGAASGRAFGFTRSAIAAATDAFFNRVTLLLPGNGTNGAQNNTFLDSSTNNFTITRNGNTTQGTFSPFSQTGWSNHFNGATTSGPFISASYSTTNFDWFTSGQDFTLECWVYPIDLATFSFSDGTNIVPRLTGNADLGGTTNYWSFGPISDGKVRFHYYNGAVVQVTSTSTVTANTWNHIAFTKTSSGIIIFVNGTATTATAVSGTPQSSASYSLVIGRINNASINGYVSNYRILKNVTPPYSGSYTVPTAPLTDISGTKILTAQANRFIDSSSVVNALTVSGSTVSVQAFSPFAPTAAYSAATVGGSGYFDGTGDNLTVPTNSANSVGSGSFYFEAWVYLTNPSVAQMIIADPSNTGGLFVGLNIDGGSRFTIGRTAVGVDNLVTVTWIGNQWYHLAVNRNGTSLQFFVNGTQVGSTGTNSVNYPSVGYRVGAEQAAGSAALTGYISGLRLVKSSVNTTNFTPPTAPPDASGSALCLQFTNAGITDATAKNDLETVGNAQISTAQSKFGGSSMYFDGTGDWLLLPASPNMAMGTGDFTFECWIYATAASDQPIYECRSTTSNTDGFTVTAFSSTVIRVYTNAVLVTATVSNYLNTWTHVAFTRAGSTNRLFINGTLQNTATASDNFSSQVAVVGGGRYGSNNIDKSFTGYIDDLRITKGYARYTASFTAPTAAFALQ